MAVPQERVAYRGDVASTAERIEQMRCDYRFHPLFGVAMLKVSFELRPVKMPGFDQILKETLSCIQADENELDDFVQLHRLNLERRCKEVGI